MSKILMDALRVSAVIKLYRASIRVYTVPEALYLVVNASFADAATWALHIPESCNQNYYDLR
jgi:hypothetical protein